MCTGHRIGNALRGSASRAQGGRVLAFGVVVGSARRPQALVRSMSPLRVCMCLCVYVTQITQHSRKTRIVSGFFTEVICLSALTSLISCPCISEVIVLNICTGNRFSGNIPHVSTIVSFPLIVTFIGCYSTKG